MTRTIGAAREACHHDPQATMRSYTAGLEAVLAGFGALGARDELPRLFVEMAQKGMAAGLEDKALTAGIDVMEREVGA